MFEIDDIKIDKALLLAPMEDVTGIAFRRLCKELGADVVYTEFVNSDGLIRNNKKTAKKMRITEEERPVGIQIYGSFIESMREAAKMTVAEKPDILDINAGCWVKKVATRGAGAGLLKDPPYLQKMVKEIVDSVDVPVTVKTRLGWDKDSIMIVDVAKRLEDVGIRALTVHCRTRQDAHEGTPDWSWIPKIREAVDIPVILNGGVMNAADIKRAFDETDADGVMVARGAINHPWIFREARELMEFGEIKTEITVDERIHTALKHLRYELDERDTGNPIYPFRKFYTGYLKGLHHASKIRQKLMTLEEYDPIEELLLNYLEELKNFDSFEVIEK